MSKTFRIAGAQGDILVVACNSSVKKHLAGKGQIPKTARLAAPQQGYWVIAHSETGHHHVIDLPRAEVYESADNEFVAWIKTMDDGAEIKHLRAFDTHEPLTLEPNTVYEIRRQREYVPQGWRRAAD